MNTPEFNLTFLHANEMINFLKKKYVYKNYYIMKKAPIFQNIAELVDDETLLELKYTCKKFKARIENQKDLVFRSNQAELKKVKEKLVKLIFIISSVPR